MPISLIINEYFNKMIFLVAKTTLAREDSILRNFESIFDMSFSL